MIWKPCCIEQRSETCDSLAICVSFQNCIWLSGLQTNLCRLSLKYCKTANTSRMASQSYHWCRLQLSCSPINQVCVESEDFCSPMWHQCLIVWLSWKPILHMSLSWLTQPKGFPTPGIEHVSRLRLQYRIFPALSTFTSSLEYECWPNRAGVGKLFNTRATFTDLKF